MTMGFTAREIELLLPNFRQLVVMVDTHCAAVERDLAQHLVCRPGCAGCCRHLTVFAVEAVHLARGLATLPIAVRTALGRRAGETAAADPCPLLEGGLCRLYATRPLICRTHGLPLLVAGEEGTRVDFCPENFQGLERLPAAAVLDLERLNLLLAAVNRDFLSRIAEHGVTLPERLSLSSALTLKL
jgi:Fe-S-cluster containining protein